ncbi:MAG: T9SS type A sorting domain-containing protein [Ignavibacteriae bacterium]|nr:T9SS type A sorting domain-containing protein [Ignavibacteria bacterium]MBI3365792.1 T9SS type A sorting domain-containing protein [Ignavibacteriota bacterium]
MENFQVENPGGSWTDITGTDLGGILPIVRKYDIVSSPTDENVMYIGTDMGVFKTTNGGATWYKFWAGMPHVVPVTNLVYVPGVGGAYDTLRIGTYGRGYWQRVLSGDDPLYDGYVIGFPIHGMDFHGNHGITVGEAGRVAHTSDDGKSWLEGSSSTGSMLNSSWLLDSLTGMAVGLAGTIIRSTDGGDSWATIPSPVLSSFFDVFFTDPINGIAVGDLGTVIHSTDGGQSWQTVMTGANATLHSIFFTDPGNGWISGTDNSGQIPMVLLLHTTDGGMSWISSIGVGPGGGCDVMFPDPNTGYLTLEGGGMMKTTDGGQSWNQLQTGTQLSLHDVFFTNPDNGWACGDGGIFMHTTDGGQQWMTEESGSDSNLYRLAMSNDHLFTAGTAGIFSKSTVAMAEVVHSLAAGWNLVSVPVLYADYSTTNVYPNASSSAFAYQGAYNPVNVLEPGDGYWLQFGAGLNIGHIGPPITSLAVQVNQDWNIIGSLSTPVDVNTITSSPENIIVSRYFGYEGTYQIVNTLQPGNAYWVKVSQDGQLMLSSPNSHEVRSSRRSQQDKLGYSSISFENNGGKRQTLFFTTRSIAPVDLNRYELPPIPPTAAFDVRYSSGRIIATSESNTQSNFPILISSASYPITINWRGRQFVEKAALIIDGVKHPIIGNGSLTLSGMSEKIQLELSPSTIIQSPQEFALDQNYPNPFNPSTVIRYSLPVESRVTLRVFDLLGREVGTLIDQIQDAGFKQVEWDANGVPSGVYVYRIEATEAATAKSYRSIKKMVLLR